MIILYDIIEMFDKIKCCPFKLLTESPRAKTIYGNTFHLLAFVKKINDKGGSQFTQLKLQQADPK